MLQLESDSLFNNNSKFHHVTIFSPVAALYQIVDLGSGDPRTQSLLVTNAPWNFVLVLHTVLEPVAVVNAYHHHVINRHFLFCQQCLISVP